MRTLLKIRLFASNGLVFAALAQAPQTVAQGQPPPASNQESIRAWHEALHSLIRLEATLDEVGRQREERFRLDAEATWGFAADQTSKGGVILFPPDGKGGDADAALPFYKRSDDSLNAFLDRWKEVRLVTPPMLVVLDLVRAQNARGLALGAFMKGDNAGHAHYQQQTIDLADSGLKLIALASHESPQLQQLKQEYLMLLVEAHMFLSRYYRDYAPDELLEEIHRQLALRYAPDSVTKARIVRFLEKH